MIKKINHVGVAVKDLDKAVSLFENAFGAKVIFRKVFEDQKLESAMVSMGENRFELSQTIDPDGVMGKFIENRGEGIHHVSLQVEDMEKAIAHFENQGLKVVGKGTVGSGGNKICFLHPKDIFGVLIEIIEPAKG
ncbi:MAG: methylmalonyl-CoA epimerase [Deltaproteobacteria bacterium]|jgi:methylmalonyl-CoA epimerase|nr:MAG: methylmalonyl-CoA epimerase [Deltaproteobacteria bacterium]